VRERPLFEWSWVTDNLDVIWTRLGEHVWLTFLAVVIGFAIALPLGILAHRKRWLYPPVASVAGILYTIPSLALFAMLLPWTGLSTTTAEIGLDGVPADAKEAALGMGYTPRQMLWRVELRLATPAIMAGVRIATVSTIGLVTVTTLIGQGGFGHILFQLGFRRFNNTAMITGAILSVALAVVGEALLLGAQKLLTPWARERRAVGV
jgi:osmoprotectant transport system permease protein